MSRANVEVVLEQFAATNDRDFGRAMELYAEDVELFVHREAFLESGTFRGQDAVGAWFGNWFGTFEPGYHFDVEEARDLGDVVVLIASHHGRGRGSGVEVEGATGYVYDVRDGKVAYVGLYPTPGDAVEAAERRASDASDG
jgi:ketosteroid isomerase-like protein